MPDLQPLIHGRPANAAGLLSGLLVGVFAVTLAGCTDDIDMDDATTMDEAPRVVEPRVTVDDIVPLQYVDALELAAYFCPEEHDAKLCEAVLGPPPPLESLEFLLELYLTVENDGDVAYPIRALRLEADLTRSDGEQTHASVCVLYCEPGDAVCTGQPLDVGCALNPEDLKGPLEDFTEQLVQLWWVVVDAATAGLVGHAEGLYDATEVPPHDARHLEVVVRADPGVMLDLVREQVLAGIDGWLAGQPIPAVAIPTEVIGGLWCDMPGRGEVVYPFGPAALDLALSIP